MCRGRMRRRSTTTAAASGDELQSVGQGRGRAEPHLLGRLRRGRLDRPKVDWVTPFEKQTGCQVNVKVGRHLRRDGRADADRPVRRRLRLGQRDRRASSTAATSSPVNVDLVPNYKTIFADLKDQPYNTFDGTHYGIPHGRGANLLMWNTDDVKPAPTSWDVILDPKKAAKYKGKISVYDDPIYIADAAVYLKAHQPDLGIDNPYELNDDAVQRRGRPAQAAAPERRRVLVRRAEADLRCSPTATTRSARRGSTSTSRCRPTASRWPPSPASQGFVPEEGATGWSDTWMISSQAAHPNCMYKWMNYIISPEGERARSRSASARRPRRARRAIRPTSDRGRQGRRACRRTRSSATSTTRPIRRSGSACTTGTRRSPTAATTAATSARTTTTGTGTRLVWRFRSPHHSCGESEMRTSEPKPH